MNRFTTGLRNTRGLRNMAGQTSLFTHPLSNSDQNPNVESFQSKSPYIIEGINRKNYERIKELEKINRKLKEELYKISRQYNAATFSRVEENYKKKRGRRR